MARFARVMWDFQMAEYGYRKRDNGLPSTPATMPVNEQQLLLKGYANVLNESWFNFVKQLNPPESKRFITAPHTGWVNQEWAEGKTFPSAECVVMSGNVLLINEISGNFGGIESFHISDNPADPIEVNYLSEPWKIHKFTVITNRGYIRNPGAGLDAYYPVLRSGEHLWIPLNRIEFFPELPLNVEVEVPLAVHESIDHPTERMLAVGQILRITEYQLTGSSVWATIEGGGCIPLLLNGIYSPTNWKMNTPPPIASKDELAEGTEPAPARTSEYDVLITAIRTIVRQGPEGGKVGELVYGRKARVYQELTKKGKTWLRIGDKRWILKEETKPA